MDNISRTTLMALPVEILLMIPRLVLEAVERDCGMRLFKNQQYSALAALSATHSFFREACIAVGLLSHITPKSVTIKGQVNFQPSFIQVQIFPPLTSLGIDLENPEVWPLCMDILSFCPDLKEICLIGK
jgi:hypothetical protein